MIRIEFDAARPAQRLFFSSGAEPTTQANSLSSRLYHRSRFFFLFSSPLSSFCRLWKFSYYPLAHDVKERRKKRKNVSTYTPSRLFQRSGLGTITRLAEPFVGHVLTFLNPLSAVLGQWMETIDREVCAVLELKRVSDRRGLVCAAMASTVCTLRRPEAVKARAANVNFWSD